MVIELLSSKEVSAYKAELYSKMKSDIEALPNEKIPSRSLEEWAYDIHISCG